MPKFPFTNYHELNLDWILKKVNALFDASEENARTIRTYDTRLNSAEQTATSAATAATSAQQLADAAAANADNALSVAGTADAKADSALTAATDASSAVSGALTIAQEAQQTAGAAVATANDAAATAAGLESLANTANQNATAAVETAGTAVTRADNADQKAVAAQQTANSAQTAANTNAGNITTLQTNVTDLNRQISGLNSSVSDISSDIYSVSDNLFDVDSVIVNAVPDSVGSGTDAFVTLNGWYISNLIPVTPGLQYALIYNNNITQGMIFRVACYSNGVMTYKTSNEVNTEPNPYTIPDGVDHIRFFSNSSGMFTNRTATSFKLYSDNMTLEWHEYGKELKIASADAINEFGVYVDGTNYYHFVRFGEKTLIRLFKREGPNNLFQFSALYVGSVSSQGVSIGQTIANNGTDTVSPISIMRQNIDSGGMWSGGWHARTINGVTCPTAEQVSLDVKINGESIVGADGLHYGKCVITAVNNLYFPQTITGLDLSTATKAIEETVTYILNEKMTARVSHKYVSDTRVILYYGMQAVRIGFDNILLPNNETYFAFSDMTANMILEKAEDLIQMSNNEWNYDLIIKPFGLAKYTHNSGVGGNKYGYLPTAVRKIYWVLMEGAYDYTFITSGKTLAWEGVWDIYPN